MAERRCHYYGRGFIADSRVGNRQKGCLVACQRLRKRERSSDEIKAARSLKRERNR